jgi:hypothetical protein
MAQGFRPLLPELPGHGSRLPPLLPELRGDGARLPPLLPKNGTLKGLVAQVKWGWNIGL